MLAGRWSGIFHAGAKQRLSLYQIAQVVNRLGGYNPKCLMGTPRSEADPIPPRAGNVCMDSTKLCDALGYDPFAPWPYDASLAPTDRDWHRDRPAGNPYSPRYMLEVLAANPTIRKYHAPHALVRRYEKREEIVARK
jgi:dTDP-4-dehydrorhamnose reductase